MSDQSNVVLADPQYGVYRLLRPQTNFETLYQGQAADTTAPLYFFEGGESRDPRAGQPGFDDNLVSGLTMPQGANVVIWVPNLTYLVSVEPPLIRSYSWFLIWRLRSVVTFRQDRDPYHLGFAKGVADTTPVSGGDRFIIPAAYETVVYNQPEPVVAIAPDSGRVIQHGRAEDMTMSCQQLGAPIIAPGTRGAIQQGVHDPTALAAATLPTFMEISTRVKGDELLIGIYRQNDPATWDFAGADAFMAEYFTSSESNGIYVSIGTP